MKNKISENKIAMIRQMKRDGNSLSEIAHDVGIAKSTISLYCRDLFKHPMRKYQTEKEARRQKVVCKSKRWHEGKRSPSDFSKRRAMHSCFNNCGQFVRVKGRLCIICHKQKRKDDAYNWRLNILKTREVKRQQRLKDTQERRQKYFKPIPIEICEASPTRRHHWKLNSDNIGVCLYCQTTRDFSLNSKVLVNA